MSGRRNQLWGKDWHRVKELFRDAQAMPKERRKAWLDGQFNLEPWIRAEVESLLRQQTDEAELVPFPAESHQEGTGELRGQIGRYDLVRRLAAGGTAEIYLARLKGASGFEKFLALKRIHPHLVETPEMQALLEHEAKLCASLNHPNIVQVYDFFRHEGSCLLVMEYIEGVSVLDLQDQALESNERLPFAWALIIAIEACKALAFAHEKTDAKTGEWLRLVHRDISPKNIMVSSGGDIKLIDFGIAKSRDRTRVTLTGMVRGTIAYMSPEQAAGRPLDNRSDLYSLGVVLFELLSGQEMIQARTPLEALQAIENNEAADRMVAAVDGPPALKSILQRVLAKRPEDRFANARELGRALESFSKGYGLERSVGSLAERVRTMMKGEAGKVSVALHTPRQVPEEYGGGNAAGARSSRPAPVSPEPAEARAGRRNGASMSAYESAAYGGPREKAPRERVLPSVRLAFVVLVVAVAAAASAKYFRRYSDGRAPTALFETPSTFVPLPTPPAAPPGAAESQVATASLADPGPAKAKPPEEREAPRHGYCRIALETDPAGARIAVNGVEVGVTPKDVDLRCGQDTELTLELEGHAAFRENIVVQSTKSRLFTTLNRKPSAKKRIKH